MRNLLFSLFAIGVAAVAAMTATTAMLNAPVREAPSAAIIASMQADPPAGSTAPGSQPAAAENDSPAPPAGDAAPAAKPATATGEPAAAGAASEEEGDKDPYEGIAPEELPPDLQYSADSSVSFPTNI